MTTRHAKLRTGDQATTSTRSSVRPPLTQTQMFEALYWGATDVPLPLPDKAECPVCGDIMDATEDEALLHLDDSRRCEDEIRRARARTGDWISGRPA